jgi:hypothetical protein
VRVACNEVLYVLGSPNIASISARENQTLAIFCPLVIELVLYLRYNLLTLARILGFSHLHTARIRAGYLLSAPASI